jgi:hypothetical protein
VFKMSYEPPTYTDAEKLADLGLKAAHWENVAHESDPDTAFHCRDYAQHLRTIADCLRMDLLERMVGVGPK